MSGRENPELDATLEASKRRREAAIEMDRPFIEERAEKLRILKDIVQEKFGTHVIFECHYGSDLDVVSSFAVFHDDKDVRTEVKVFVKSALPRICLRIDWEGRDVIDIPIRKEKASEAEKAEMLKLLE